MLVVHAACWRVKVHVRLAWHKCVCVLPCVSVALSLNVKLEAGAMQFGRSTRFLALVVLFRSLLVPVATNRMRSRGGLFFLGDSGWVRN